MRTIVVGVDGSPASLAALSWSDVIARRTGARLVAVRADVPGRGELSVGLAAQAADRARHELEVACRKQVLTTTPDFVVTDKDPRSGLVEAAADHDADMLVVGAHGMSRLAGQFLGGVTSHLAVHPTRPLAIVLADAAPVTDHIVVGVDGSNGSLAAVDFCAVLASDLEVPVTAVCAQEPFAEWVPDSDPPSWYATARQHVGEWTEPIAAAGVAVDVVVDRDIHPVAALGRVLDARAGSVAVTGTRGRGGFAGLRLGRVPLQLLQRTRVPVVIVPVPRT